MSTTSVCQTLLSLTQNFIHLSSCSETAVVRRSRQGMPVPAVVERLDVIGGVSNGRYSHFVASAMRLFVLEAIEETRWGIIPAVSFAGVATLPLGGLSSPCSAALTQWRSICSTRPSLQVVIG